MKKNLIYRIALIMTILSCVSQSLYAQKNIQEADVVNMKTLSMFIGPERMYFDFNGCESYFIVSDLDYATINKYSSIKMEIGNYVQKFGEYVLKPIEGYSWNVLSKRAENVSIFGVKYDTETGALVMPPVPNEPAIYLFMRGDSGITYDKKGARYDFGEAKLDDKGRIIDWYDRSRQRKLINYDSNGRITLVTMRSRKYEMKWTNGNLSEMIIREDFGQKKIVCHYWYEIVEKNEDGLWTVADIYIEKNNTKTKVNRYTRKFE